MKSPLEFALAYAKLGWSIFPVWSSSVHVRCRCPKGNDCQSPGKHPHGLAPHGHLDATTDTVTIEQWFASDSQAGIGITCDRSGLVVLDIDPRNGGTETLAKIETEHGPLTSNCVADTQGGGEHRYFQVDPDVTFPATLGPGLDLKHHGYVIVEPSKGPLGQYRWREGCSPFEGGQPSELPDCIISLCRSIGKRKRSADQSYPVATAQTFNDLRDALRHINADDYQTWVTVGLALRPYEEIGYDIWKGWSATSKKFDEKALRYKWDRDIDYPESVTYLSIFAMARDAGWSGNSPSDASHTHAADDELQDPENLFEIHEPAAFDPDASLPPVIADWVKAHAAASGLDAVGYAFAALPVLAAATNRDVRINLGHGHNVPVIIWSAIVGATGSGKSPAMIAAHRPLSAMNAREFQRVQAEKRMWAKTPKSERAPEQPALRHVRYTSDTTTEALTANLANSDGPRLLVHYDEGSGWLNNMGRYSSGGDGDRATYLSSWLGLPNHIVSRVGRGEIFVPELGANILFGITPNKIKEGLEEATAEGLLARTWVCLIQRRTKSKSSGPDDSNLAYVDDTYAQLVQAISKIHDCEVSFRPQAQAQLDDLRARYGDMSVDLESTLPALAAVLAKAAENLGRLAGLFRLCREPEPPYIKFSIQPRWTIEIDDLSLAKNLMDVALDHAQAAYTGLLMTDKPTAVARECALKILRLHLDNHNTREVHRDQFMKIAAFKNADKLTQAGALELLRTYHWLVRDTTQRHHQSGGRFSDGTRWLINRKALDGRFNTYAIESASRAAAAISALRTISRTGR